jgi:hypothetical protein
MRVEIGEAILESSLGGFCQSQSHQNSMPSNNTSQYLCPETFIHVPEEEYPKVDSAVLLVTAKNRIKFNFH